ncbi:MAG: hypothetical protein IPK19_37950 [Chloroflexi bacterium]|nr:hypothetical protein [Chloroflexota bacterium]
MTPEWRQDEIHRQLIRTVARRFPDLTQRQVEEVLAVCRGLARGAGAARRRGRAGRLRPTVGRRAADAERRHRPRPDGHLMRRNV